MAEYHRTLFLTGIQGQYKIWKTDFASACNRSDSVVQFGNLIGCNDFVKDRDSFGANEAVLKFVMLYRSTQEKWTQLVGANEIAALNLPKEWTNATSRKILRDAWLGENPTMTVAAVDKNRLLTHAGLTYGEWLSIGSPETAIETASRLNEKYMGTIYQGPCYRLGDAPNFAANPIWADTVMELYSSWITAPVPMPFDQMHGSGNLSNESSRSLLTDKTSLLSYVDEVRFQKFGSLVTVKGMQFTAIDLQLPDEITPSVPRPKSVYIEKLKVNTS
jgi:hypothetical protein